MKFKRWIMEPNHWRGSKNIALMSSISVGLLSYFLFDASISTAFYLTIFVFIASFSYVVYWFVNNNNAIYVESQK